MVDQVQHYDVCSVVNNRQTGAMTLQVKTHTNSVSDINMDSEKVEGFVISRLDMYRTNVLVYHTMVLLAHQTKV
jgi:hypothetical protein